MPVHVPQSVVLLQQKLNVGLAPQVVAAEQVFEARQKKQPASRQAEQVCLPVGHCNDE